MDSLLAGTLILPWKGHCAGYDVQRRCACGNHSGLSRKPFRDQAKTVRLPAGITIRLQLGILFVFTPESFSRSPRNPVRLAPESATGPEMLKLLFHSETLKLLGIQAIGQRATEIIHIGQAVLAFGGTVEYFRDAVFNYPTLTEAYKVAALNGLNKL
jgi:hypothetical protein